MADSISFGIQKDVAERGSEDVDTTEGEVLLLSVFEACSVHENQRVRVSKLIDHLFQEAAADENPKILGYLDELAVILDPSGTDISINKEMYTQGVRDWIQTVQARRSYQEFDDSEARLTGIDNTNPVFVYKGRGESDQSLQAFANGYGEKSLENHSFYSTESSNEWEKSQSEILGRIQELQVANKKLSEEKAKLRLQVDNTEEANSTLHNEIKMMKNKLSKYEQLFEKNKSLEKDYESIKNKVNDYHCTREELLTKTGQLEKENAALQLVVEDYQKSDLAKNSVLEALREENRELMQKLNEQKQLYSDLEVLQDLKQKMVDESSSKSEYMTSFIAELSMANEALKAEKSRLEVDLLESKHEISKLAAMRSPSSAMTRQPIYASTPFQRTAPVNLQQELDHERVSGNASSSSRDRSGVRLSHSANDKSKNDANESGRSDTSVSTAASTDKYSSVAQQIAMNFKRKKDLALKQIAELAALDANADAANNSKVLIANYEEGLDTFASEVEGLAAAKQLAECRSVKLMESLELAKAENKRLAENQEKALLKLGDISLTSGEMEQRINGLVEEIDREKERVEELLKENEKLAEQLTVEQAKNSELNHQIKSFQDSKTESQKQGATGKVPEGDEDQVEDLIALVSELEARGREYTRKLFDFEMELEDKDLKISEKAKEIQRLKAVYLETKENHNSDLKQIFDMFSLPENSSDTAQVHESVSIESLKDKLEQFMASFKAKMQSMGIRDGPVGSEGNDQLDEALDSKAQLNFPDQHLEVECFPQRESSLTSGMTSLVSMSSQTDIGLLEMEEAIHAFTMLKALQQKDADVNPATEDGNRCDGLRGDSPGTDPHLTTLDDNDYRSTDLTGHAGNGSSDKETAGNGDLVPSSVTSRTMPGLKEKSIDTNQSRDRDHEALDELIQGKSGESADPRSVSGTYPGSQERASVGSPGESPEEAPVEKRVGRWLLKRSESVSTDESNTSDEMGEVVLEQYSNSRKTSTKSEPSIVESETSVLSTASKKARRIGISAEPVRLPTWTELRESIKLNQQIFLEEEMTNDRNAQTSRSSTDATFTSDLERVESVHSEKPSEMGPSSMPPASADWSCDVPADQANRGTSADVVQSKDDGVDFSATESKTSIASSVFSLAESSQTYNSSASSKGSQFAIGGKNSEEEEKGSDFKAESKDKLGELKHTSTLHKNEEHPATSIARVDKDIEKRYNTAVLSFKTDQYTLQRRLENQERARDVAESGMEREIRKLNEKLQSAEKFSFTRELKEILISLVGHTDVLRKAGMKVSAQAEQHGCFQQESRIAPTIETVITYAEHLRLSLERSREADEIRKRDLNSSYVESLAVNEINGNSKNHGFCNKCRGVIMDDDECKIDENGHLGEEKGQNKDKSDSLTFFGLTSSILRERSSSQVKSKTEKENEAFVQHREDYEVKPDFVNYSSNQSKEDQMMEESVSISEKPARSLLDCVTMVFRFFVSVAMLSTVLFLFSNYVEIDLTRMVNNWNEQLIMYAKRFAKKDEEGR